MKQVLELLNDDFDTSKIEESDFGDDELYSYLPGLYRRSRPSSQDDSLTVEEVQLSPGNDRLQSL